MPNKTASTKATTTATKTAIKKVASKPAVKKTVAKKSPVKTKVTTASKAKPVAKKIAPKKASAKTAPKAPTALPKVAIRDMKKGQTVRFNGSTGNCVCLKAAWSPRDRDLVEGAGDKAVIALFRHVKTGEEFTGIFSNRDMTVVLAG